MEGQSVMVFLTGRCNDLRQRREDLARQLREGPPTVAEHSDFILGVIRIQEQLPCCEALRNALSYAMLNRTSLLDAVKAAVAQLDAGMAVHMRTIRAELGTLRAALAKESLTVMLQLHEELLGFHEEAVAQRPSPLTAH
jgi:hypothetical protein